MKIKKLNEEYNKGEWVEVNLNTKKNGTPNIIPVKVDKELYHGKSFLGWAWGERQYEYPMSAIVNRIDGDDTTEIIRRYSLTEAIEVETIGDYITDHYDFDDIDDKYSCINSIRDSFKNEKTISEEELEQFIGAHNGRDKVNESKSIKESLIGDEYKGYSILIDHDIFSSEEETITLNWKIYDKDGNYIDTVTGLRNAKNYVDELTINQEIEEFLKDCVDGTQDGGGQHYFILSHYATANLDCDEKIVIKVALDNGYQVYNYKDDCYIIAHPECDIERIFEYFEPYEDTVEDFSKYLIKVTSINESKPIDEGVFDNKEKSSEFKNAMSDFNLKVEKITKGESLDNIANALTISLRDSIREYKRFADKDNKGTRFTDTSNIYEGKGKQILQIYASIVKAVKKPTNFYSPYSMITNAIDKILGDYTTKSNILFRLEPYGNILNNITQINADKNIKIKALKEFYEVIQYSLNNDYNELRKSNPVTLFESIESKSIKESNATHCVYFEQDGIEQIEFEGTEDECDRYISAIQAEQDDEFGDEAPERFVKRINESTQPIKESLNEDTDTVAVEGPKEGPEAGLSSLINEAIQDELKTIDIYNSLAITARSEGYKDIAKMIDEINTEENKHVGQLQEALKSISPNAIAIEDGTEEGQEQLSNAVMFDDDLSDDELGVALFKLR